MVNQLESVRRSFGRPWNEVGLGMPDGATILENISARVDDVVSLGVVVSAALEFSDGHPGRASVALTGYTLLRIMRKNMLERRSFLERYGYAS